MSAPFNALGSVHNRAHLCDVEGPPNRDLAAAGNAEGSERLPKRKLVLQLVPKASEQLVDPARVPLRDAGLRERRLELVDE
jgi:hypothetical protein